MQYGLLPTVDGLTFSGHRSNSGMPLIQMSDDNPSGTAGRNAYAARQGDRPARRQQAGPGQPRRRSAAEHSKTPSRVCRSSCTEAGTVPGQDGEGGQHGREGLRQAIALTYEQDVPLTGDESRVARVSAGKFPELLDPVDDLPPTTVITHVVRKRDGKIVVRGTTSDNGTVKKVMVNGQDAKALTANFASGRSCWAT